MEYNKWYYIHVLTYDINTAEIIGTRRRAYIPIQNITQLKKAVRKSATYWQSINKKNRLNNIRFRYLIFIQTYDINKNRTYYESKEFLIKLLRG